MTIIGELERAFGALIFPNLVPLSILAAVGLVLLAIFARRRGWDQRVKRHPRAALAALAVILVVGIPAGWYFLSPLWIRTELVEPAPVAVGASPAPTSTAPTASGAPTSVPATTVPSSAPVVPAGGPRSGTFVGTDSFHFGRGGVSIIETTPGSYTLRFDEFEVQNGPDLFVFLSSDPDGYTDGAIEVGTLRATSGSFNHVIPAGTDVTGIRSVVIWCKAFGVQFAHAELPAG